MARGTVTRLFSDFADVALDGEGGTREVVTARLRGRLAGARADSSLLAAGDLVEVEVVGADAVIGGVLPRRTKISRQHPGNPRREQVIAANVDQVLMLVSAEQPPFRAGLVDRYLVAASAEGLAAALCLTKCDLVEHEAVEALLAPYREIGVPCFLVARGETAGLEALRSSFLAGRTTVLVGQSGVGKTTLRNALLPAAARRTAEISSATGHGRHATTAATFEILPPSGFLVDTPGAREFGLWRLAPEDVASHFPEFAELRCRFGDCAHDTEPGCALLDRVAQGLARAERLQSLRSIAASLRT